jgi:hypothetical protein
LCENEEVESGHRFLIPFAVSRKEASKYRSRLELVKGAAGDSQIWGENESSFGIIVSEENVFRFRRSLEDAVDPFDRSRRNTIDVRLDD